MLRGDQVKEFLVERSKHAESGKSSHWEEQLRNFSYSEGEGFKGVQGFGGISKPSLSKNLYHALMQAPYKRQGKELKAFREMLGSVRKIAEKQNRSLDLDILRHAIVAAFCKEKIPDFSGNKVSVVIGDGFGVMSALLLMNTDCKVVSINLSEVLLVDYIYTRGLIADESTALVEQGLDLEEAMGEKDIRLIYVRADNHSLLRNLPIDMVFNIGSMQEMNPPVIEEYFDDIRSCKSKSLYFYCCNRIEKTLPDGTITRFFDYPWQASDEIIVDELCPWQQNYYVSKPPFYRNFEGPVQHRLIRLNNSL